MSSPLVVEWNPSVPELTFCKAYNSLLQSNPQQIANDAVQAFGAQNVAPVILSKMPKTKLLDHQLINTHQNSADLPSEPAISIEIKGLRAPYKFTSKLPSVPCTNTIFTTKTLLIASFKSGNTETADSDAYKYLKPSHIKLLKKGKLISDSKLLKEIAEDSTSLNLVAMISEPSQQEIDAAKQENAKQPDPKTLTANETYQNISVSVDDMNDKIWAQVLVNLQSVYGKQKAAAVLDHLKSGWVLVNEKAETLESGQDLD